MCLLIGHGKQSFQIPKTNIHWPCVAQKIAAREFFYFMKGHQYGYHGVILTMFVNHVRSVRAQNNALRKIGCWVTISRNQAGCSFKNKTRKNKLEQFFKMSPVNNLNSSGSLRMTFPRVS